MKELFGKYLLGLYQHVPIEVKVSLLLFFFLGVVVILVYKREQCRWRFIAGLIFIEFVALLYCSMVIFRSSYVNPKYNFLPFWSYTAIQEGRLDLIPENVMNIIVFIPVGFLLGMTFPGIKWWMVLLFGGGLSVSIELLQFIFKRGFSEVDDVIHNIVGCLIGYSLYKMCEYTVERYKRY